MPEPSPGIVEVSLYRLGANGMYERLLPMGTPQDPCKAYDLANKLDKHIMMKVICNSEYNQSSIKEEIQREGVIAHDVFCLNGDLTQSLLSVVTPNKKNILIFFTDHSESVALGRTATAAIGLDLANDEKEKAAATTKVSVAAAAAAVPLPDHRGHGPRAAGRHAQPRHDRRARRARLAGGRHARPAAPFRALPHADRVQIRHL